MSTPLPRLLLATRRERIRVRAVRIGISHFGGVGVRHAHAPRPTPGGRVEIQPLSGHRRLMWRRNGRSQRRQRRQGGESRGRRDRLLSPGHRAGPPATRPEVPPNGLLGRCQRSRHGGGRARVWARRLFGVPALFLMARVKHPYVVGRGLDQLGGGRAAVAVERLDRAGLPARDAGRRAAGPAPTAGRRTTRWPRCFGPAGWRPIRPGPATAARQAAWPPWRNFPP